MRAISVARWRCSFRFQNGSIKSMAHAGTASLNERFDSKMVRLKDREGGNKRARQSSFDSKMVRLKGRFDTLDNEVLCRFDSKMVRLKERTLPRRIDVFEVSIPKWFD